MDLNDLKIYGLNLFSFSLSFANIEQGLKIILLTVSILYTVLKVLQMKNDKKL